MADLKEELMDDIMVSLKYWILFSHCYSRKAKMRVLMIGRVLCTGENVTLMLS